MTIQTIPLTKLVASAHNVRKTVGAAIDDLAASIAAHGLLQNLQVRALVGEDGAPTDKYEVVAGGRRLAALKSLAKSKRVPKDMAVPCNILDHESATEVSLAENVIRQAMHPADQYEAFAALAAQGLGVEAIATRFGVSAGQVVKLLKLASVSPSLMAAYRAEEMTLDHLMAFTVSGDHAAQERVWAELPSANPRVIRQALTEVWVDAGDRLARLVGIDHYVAAGGSVSRDLFQEAHEGYLTDRPLLERLARVALETRAAEVVAEGWQWVEIIPDFYHAAVHGMRQLTPEHRELSPAEAEEQDALSSEYDALADGDTEDEDTLARIAVIEARFDALGQSSVVWTEAMRETAGAVVALAHDGTLAVTRGLVQIADSPEDEDTPVTRTPAARPSLPATLVRDLTGNRTAGLRVALTERPDVALDAVIFALVRPLFYSARQIDSCLGIRVEHPSLTREVPGYADTTAARRIEEHRARWQQELPEAEGFWDWLRAQPQERKLALLAFAAAETLSAVEPGADARKRASNAHADLLHLATGLDMREWWEPTRERYLGRVPKKLVATAVTEACGSQIGDPLLSMKRDEAVDRAGRLLAGTGWLPALLRTPVGTASPEVAEHLPEAA